MIVKAKFIEIIWDNYQAGSGKPITRSVLIELDDETKLCDIENEVLKSLTSKCIKGTYCPADKEFPYDRLLKVELLPTLSQLAPKTEEMR